MTTDTERARLLLARDYGLSFQGSLAQRLARTVQSLPRVAFASELLWLRSLVELVTIQESYVLRHPAQLEAIARHTRARPRVWSAACARGEEALSLSMVLQGRGDVQIIASDVSAESIAFAKAGHYRARSLRGLDASLVQRHFVEVEGCYFARPELVSPIHYRRLNLACRETAWPESLDVVLLRNVLFYFTDEQIAAVLDRARLALRPGGLLVVAPAEAGIVAMHGWRPTSGLPTGCFSPSRVGQQWHAPAAAVLPLHPAKPRVPVTSKPLPTAPLVAPVAGVAPGIVLEPKDAAAALARRLVRNRGLPDA